MTNTSLVSLTVTTQSPSSGANADIGSEHALERASIGATTAERELEVHRRELTGYCYRMLGSGFEAEDAVQETMIRAWRGIDSFEGRSAFRSWLYRIATNVCLDILRSRQRRARPMDLGPSSPADPTFLGRARPEYPWVLPISDVQILAEDADPAELAAMRDTVRLAFIAALQHLPARQRAVLILRDVLRWQAAEVAELLDTTLASVNSALQRARATLAARIDDTTGRNSDDLVAEQSIDADQQVLLAKYLDAFERYDMSTFVALLREDAIQSMPPFAMWLQGSHQIVRWMLGPGIECRDSRLLRTSANGSPAFGQYRIDPAGGYAPWGLHVLEISGGRVAELTIFLDTQLFPAFGLPLHLDG
jgi:RNA polymerase sigma-70 factor (ECF subfamily)